jgi:hypothetical protein
MKKHRHYWKSAGMSGKIAYEVCRCEKKRERPTTKAERQHIKEMWRNAGRIHKLYHAFMKRFMDGTLTFKGQGYELSQRIERWAKHHPEVKQVRCDDSYHAGSDLFLIPHATDREYHGTTVVYVPQCTGEKPIEFFLYPVGHHEPLQRALADIKREHKRKRGWN